MDDGKKSASLDQYFSGEDRSGSSFFDHLSDPGGSAMMTSVVASPSTQDLFEAASETMDGVVAAAKTLSLDDGEEPVVCKLFREEEKTGTKSFFDVIGSGGSETGDAGLSEWSEALGNFEGPFPSAMLGFEEATDSIWGSEMDRTREAWVPCERTRRALIQAATSPSGSNPPEPDLLTRPAIVQEEPLVDNVTQLLRHHFGEAEASRRKVLTVDEVSKDERGLRQLIQAECFRAAINLTGKLLAVYGPAASTSNRGKPAEQPPRPTRHTPHSVQLWFTRLALLVKIGSYQIAEAESAPWWDLDRPDLYFQFYPELYGGKPGTMVPFQMRLLLATIPSYLKRHSAALDRLYWILGVVRLILRNLSEGKSEDGSLIELTPRHREMAHRVWNSREARTLHSIVNVALQAKEFPLAISIIKHIIKNTPVSCQNQLRSLHSALGRIYLQVGNVTRADACFTASKELKSNNTPDIRELVDKALLEVSRGTVREAYETLSRAQSLDPSDNCITNNMAACLLYEGRLRDAISLLQQALESRPSTALAEPLLVNLATLHELDSSNAEIHKRSLLRLVAQHRGDSFNVASLKLQR